ncbi:MAG: hypothetical protein KJ017_03745 [Alphaproteobacteria bacterium]|nr:hypothetical protein [Alphaproteobacteria bacterium]
MANCTPLIFTFPKKIDAYDVPTVKLFKSGQDKEFKVLSYVQSETDADMLQVKLCLSSEDIDTHFVALEYDVQNPHPEFWCIQSKRTPALNVLLEHGEIDIGQTM